MKKITTLFVFMAFMLASFTAGMQYERGDVDQNGQVDIADVTCLVDYLLCGTWGDDPVNPDDTLDGHSCVDLGLPSGTLWATCNVGADTPEGFGDHFAWGEIEPKDNYGWTTYKWCNGSENTLTKYCSNRSYGTVDNKTELDPEDDVAYVKWGPSWRMPTREQMVELRTYCTWVWKIQNSDTNSAFDTYGILLTGPNGNTMFLPAAGFHYGTWYEQLNQTGIYWSRSLSPVPHEAYSSQFTPMILSGGYCSREVGRAVRPVRVSQD